jgi:DNA repair protein RecO (recombination protein O)
MRAREADLPPRHVFEQASDLVHRQRRAAVKRVDVHLVQLELHFHQVMSGQPHTRRVQSDFGRYVQKDDRKRDRNADLPIDHLVEIGVAWIVVVGRVATIRIDVEHFRMHVAELEDRRLAANRAAFHAFGEIIELRDINIHIESRIVLEGDQQRSAREVLIRDLPLGELTKLSPRLGGMNHRVGHAEECTLGSMRIERTEAIILHTFPARERDKLVVFLTPDHGKRKGWAYGARGLKNRFGAALEPLAKVNLGYLERETEEAVRIESVDLVRSLFPAQQDLASSIAATYIAELVDTFAQSGDPAELIYRLLDRTTEALLHGANPTAVVAYAEIWMLRLAGIFPSTRDCIECGSPIERPLRFDDRLQGFVCSTCATREASVLSNEVADALDALSRQPVMTFAAQGLPAEVLFEMRSLAGSIRRHFLGHELKSFEVLAGVLG